MAKEHPLVLITWVDAEQEAGWKDKEAIEQLKLPVCLTVGWLIKKPTKKSPMYVVAQTIGETDDSEYNGVMKIPKPWVQGVTQLNDGRDLTEKL